MSTIPLPALSMKPLEQIDPMEQYAKMLSFQQLRQRGQLQGLEIQSYQQQQQKQTAIQQALQEAGGDAEKALPKIMQIDPAMGSQMQQRLVQWKSASIEEKKKIIDLNIAKVQRFGQIASSVVDESSWQAGIAQGAKEGLLDQEQAKMYAAMPYSPELVKSKQVEALTAKEKLELAQKALEAENKPPATTAPGSMVYDQKTKTWKQIGTKADMSRTPFEEWRAANPKAPIKAWFDLQKPTEDTSAEAEDYADSLERGTVLWPQVPIKIRGKVTGIINKRGSVILNPKQREGLVSGERAEAIINAIDEASKKIHSGATVPGQKWVSGLAETAQSVAAPAGNPDLDALQSGAAALGPIIRNLGEMGNLSEGDIARAVAAVPVSRFMTRKEAEARLAKLREFVRASKKAIQSVAGKTANELFKGSVQPSGQGGIKIERDANGRITGIE